LKINLGMGAILFTLRAKELRISFEASFADWSVYKKINVKYWIKNNKRAFLQQALKALSSFRVERESALGNILNF
jgi:hypothetical protein